MINQTRAEDRPPSLLPVVLITFFPVILLVGPDWVVTRLFGISRTEYLNVYYYLLALVYGVLVLLLVGVIRKEHSRIAFIFNFDLRKLPLDLGIGVGIVAAKFLVINPIYERVWGLFLPIPQVTYFGSQPPPALFFVLLLPGLAAFTEELLWRGYVISRFLVVMRNPMWSIFLSSIGFAIWHWSLYSSGYEFFTGILYGLVYLRIRRLTPTIAGHWLYDSIAAFIIYQSLIPSS